MSSRRLRWVQSSPGVSRGLLGTNWGFALWWSASSEINIWSGMAAYQEQSVCYTAVYRGSITLPLISWSSFWFTDASRSPSVLWWPKMIFTSQRHPGKMSLISLFRLTRWIPWLSRSLRDRPRISFRPKIFHRQDFLCSPPPASTDPHSGKSERGRVAGGEIFFWRSAGAYCFFCRP